MDRHLTAATFVVFQNKTLLHLHKKFHLWLPVGGHIDPNESPAEAAIREAKEEAGLDVELFVRHEPIFEPYKIARPLIAPIHMQTELIAEDHEHIDCIFYARANSFDLHPDEGEAVEIGWYAKDELETLSLGPDVKAYALEALKLLETK